MKIIMIIFLLFYSSFLYEKLNNPIKRYECDSYNFAATITPTGKVFAILKYCKEY